MIVHCMIHVSRCRRAAAAAPSPPRRHASPNTPTPARVRPCCWTPRPLNHPLTILPVPQIIKTMHREKQVPWVRKWVLKRLATTADCRLAHQGLPPRSPRRRAAVVPPSPRCRPAVSTRSRGCSRGHGRGCGRGCGRAQGLPPRSPRRRAAVVPLSPRSRHPQSWVRSGPRSGGTVGGPTACAVPEQSIRPRSDCAETAGSRS